MIIQLRAVFCPLVQYHVRHFPVQSWTVVAFPFFTVVMSFTSWYAFLLLCFLRFSSISLHRSLQFSFPFCMRLLMMLAFPRISQILRFESFPSQLSPFITQVKNFCSDPGFFLLTFAKNLTGCFSHCCVESGDH